MLRTIPNLQLLELPESTWCCGSAGIYNITQPEMANELLERKVKHIKSTGAKVVATGNPGCLLQVINGCERAGVNVRFVHHSPAHYCEQLAALVEGAERT